MNEAFRPSDLLDKIMIRVPEGWRDRLQAMARNNRRSTNAEILTHLAKAIAEAEKFEAAR